LWRGKERKKRWLSDRKEGYDYNISLDGKPVAAPAASDLGWGKAKRWGEERKKTSTKPTGAVLSLSSTHCRERPGKPIAG
jgi:hypothetical protein